MALERVKAKATQYKNNISNKLNAAKHRGEIFQDFYHLFRKAKSAPTMQSIRPNKLLIPSTLD